MEHDISGDVLRRCWRFLEESELIHDILNTDIAALEYPQDNSILEMWYLGDAVFHLQYLRTKGMEGRDYSTAHSDQNHSFLPKPPCST